MFVTHIAVYSRALYTIGLAKIIIFHPLLEARRWVWLCGWALWILWKGIDTIKSKKVTLTCMTILDVIIICMQFFCCWQMREHLNIKNYDGCSQLHRPCVFKTLGCNFEGTTYQLDRHEHDERRYHYHLINSTCKH